MLFRWAFFLFIISSLVGCSEKPVEKRVTNSITLDSVIIRKETLKKQAGVDSQYFAVKVITKIDSLQDPTQSMKTGNTYTHYSNPDLIYYEYTGNTVRAGIHDTPFRNAVSRIVLWFGDQSINIDVYNLHEFIFESPEAARRCINEMLKDEKIVFNAPMYESTNKVGLWMPVRYHVFQKSNHILILATPYFKGRDGRQLALKIYTATSRLQEGSS
jgi:hypothetical protein